MVEHGHLLSNAPQPSPSRRQHVGSLEPRSRIHFCIRCNCLRDDLAPLSHLGWNCSKPMATLSIEEGREGEENRYLEPGLYRCLWRHIRPLLRAHVLLLQNYSALRLSGDLHSRWGCSLLVVVSTVYSLAHCLDSDMQDIWAVWLGVYFPTGRLSGRRCAELRFDM